MEGELDLGVGGLEAGAILILRINNTKGPVDETVTVDGTELEIKFDSSQGQNFTVLASEAKININDIITIEGRFSFKKPGEYEVLGAADVTLFVGDGPMVLENGLANPLARGFLISGATIGLVKNGEGEDAQYALDATGTVRLIGVPETSLSGPVHVRLNSFSDSVTESIEVPGKGDPVTVSFEKSESLSSEGDPFFEFMGEAMAMSLGAQTMFCNVSVKRQKSTKEAYYRIHVDNFQADFGDENQEIISLRNGEGDVLLLQESTVASVSGDLLISAESVEASGEFIFEYNGTGSAINENFFVDGELKSFSVSQGPFT